MFVTALAAGLMMFAEATPAAPAEQAAKPQMQRVCVKKKSDNTNIPKVSCYMQPVKPAVAPTEMAKVGEDTDASTTH
ncbi:MAG TPA: hypothetical protein VFW47_10105 [Phenylobacterium sp.]|nr:hypothetical protein [Phenylobacterium sp.]